MWEGAKPGQLCGDTLLAQNMSGPHKVTINFLTLMAHMRWKVIPENLLNGLEGSMMCL